MSKSIVREFEATQLRQIDFPKFSPGDTLEVRSWVSEGSKKRLQLFEGAVIAKKNRGLNSSFTVRRKAHNCNVERVFQTHAPTIDSIRVVKFGKVRKAKLYYLRGKFGKAARIQEKIVSNKNKHKSPTPLASSPSSE